VIKKPVFLLVMLLAILILALPACSGGSSRGPQVDGPAPDLRLENLSGQSISLSGFPGKTVFLNFWTTTCPPCVEEMPYIQEFYQDWAGGNGVVVLAINMGESAATVKRFMQSQAYTFPVLLDSQAKTAEKYRVLYFPTSIVVDREGTIRYRVIGGFRDKEAIIRAVQGFLK
jgi:thiol-disulfide isomerase/thioredoxin